MAKMITIMQALTKLKTLDKRIEKSIDDLNVVTFVQGDNPVVGFGTQADFSKQAEDSLKSIKSLIDERDKIKRKIVKSNSETNVEIVGVEMTVAEAIEKKTSIKNKISLYDTLNNQLVKSLNTVELKNIEVQDKLQRLLESQFSKDIKTNGSEVETITKSYLKTNEWKLLDKVGKDNARTILDNLFQEISKFEEQVDFRLAESNTITKIDIE